MGATKGMNLRDNWFAILAVLITASGGVIANIYANSTSDAVANVRIEKLEEDNTSIVNNIDKLTDSINRLSVTVARLEERLHVNNEKE